jgi:ATP-binding cassette subfamily C (CFTR/MRP) protein 1
MASSGVALASLQRAHGSEATEEAQHLLSVSSEDSASDEGVAAASLHTTQRWRRSPLDTCTLWQRVTFSWLSPLLTVGQQRQLQSADVPPLCARDDPDTVRTAFDAAWAAAPPGPHRLTRALLWMERDVLLKAGLAKFVHDTVMFASPSALRALLCHISGTPGPSWSAGLPGWFLVFIMFTTSLLQCVTIAQYFHYGYTCGMNARAALVLACYRKSLRMAPAERARFTSGEVMTFVTTDAKRIQDAAPYLQMAWSGPYQIFWCVALLWSTLGPSFWAGIGVILVLLPLSGILSGVMVRLEAKLMAAKDARVSRTAEALQAMKLVKSCAWEPGFAARITAARAAELRQLTLSVSFQMFFGVLWECIPLLVAMTSFLVFVRAGGQLTAANIFASLALFDIIRFPILVATEVITQSASALVSLKRIQRYLETEDVAPSANTNDDAAAAAPVDVRAASLAWAPDVAPVVEDVTLVVGQGQLVCLCGQVGSGKSTLVAGLLNDLQPVKGSIAVSGSVAYCAQTPFIVSGTLRDNILFGAPFDADKYAAVVTASALDPDIALLPAGDATEIGEHGVNLSGGQRQRVALARCAYSGASVYIFDDPLSAVDAHVGRHIYTQLLGPTGLLRSKARLLVTHGAQYLGQADRVYVMQRGRVVEQGTWSELQALGPASHTHTLLQLQAEGETTSEGAAAATQEHVVSAADVTSPDDSAKQGPDAGDAAAGGDGALTEVERRKEGTVDRSVYAFYIRKAGWWQTLGVLLLFMAWTALLAVSKWWLALWAAAGGRTSTHWSNGYVSICCSALVVLLARQALRTSSQIGGGRRMHNALLHGVLRARLSFFVRTPTGRVLNRFSGDCATVDERLHDDACDFLRQATAVGATAVVIAAATPALLLALPPLGWAFGRVQRRYGASARELQRLESVARSPIFSAVSEALSGVTTIRAFRQVDRFQDAHATAVSVNLAAFFACQSTNRWLTVRTEALAACVVGLAAGGALVSRGRVDPGAAGLSISYALSACSSLSWLVRALSMVETEVVSVERMKEFSELVPEPPLVIHDSRPPPGWPHSGAIVMKDVTMRYRPDLPLVLSGLNCSIRGGEKIGIVGRTGAGKSSILLALLRLADPECMGGTVLIDGVDTSRIGVGDLRSKLAVIPQEGTLFAGSLRFNLDPLAACTDAQLAGALKMVGLFTTMQALDTSVSEEGGNWSAGQRQLLCLARAALRDARVVLADEATSSCDAETDAMMQAAMRSAFAAATVLVVAHRLGTIADGAPRHHAAVCLRPSDSCALLNAQLIESWLWTLAVWLSWTPPPRWRHSHWACTARCWTRARRPRRTVSGWYEG